MFSCVLLQYISTNNQLGYTFIIKLNTNDYPNDSAVIVKETQMKCFTFHQVHNNPSVDIILLIEN